MRALLVALVVVSTPAFASTIQKLSPAELYAGADRVVDGKVVSLRTQWNAYGLETIATLDSGIELVIPGGTLGTTKQIVFGAPTATLGEHARWFLRDRGDGKLGVYGWSQGKWGGATPYFSTNGMHWPTSEVPYFVHRAGSDDLPFETVVATIDAAFATWHVPCSSLRFQNAGTTTKKLATDNVNVILFIEHNWIYGVEAAAATSLWIIDGEQTADIAMNGDHYTWVIGPPNSLYATTLDLQAVLTHEIGHFLGLSHTSRAFDTMYFAWKPWQSQRTISIDDKLGACTLYPANGDECGTCPAGESCLSYPQGHLCTGTPDPIGASCNSERVECDAFCLFTAADLSTGYCSRFCNTNADCPLTHHCEDASAGTETVKVCFVGAQPMMPGGEEPAACVIDDACPLGQHCDAERGACTFDCRVDADCEHATCNDRGLCESTFTLGGGGCQTHDSSAFAVLALLFLRRRRR